MLQAFHEGIATLVHPVGLTASPALRPGVSLPVARGVELSLTLQGRWRSACANCLFPRDVFPFASSEFAQFTCQRGPGPLCRSGAWPLAPLVVVDGSDAAGRFQGRPVDA